MKKNSRLSIGPFINWKVSSLPNCVSPQKRRKPSPYQLTYTQRNYVLKCYGYASYTAYLKSDLWVSIRARVLKRNPLCSSGCGSQATQVHHRTYSEAVLLGEKLTGLTPLCAACHHGIEFDEDANKSTLGQANAALKSRQSANAETLRPATDVEVERFLAGKKMPLLRKVAVQKRLRET